MAPPKKMSLQEFFDMSYGGSWADDDINMASISVPIEKGYGSPYPGDHYGHSGSSFSRNSSGGPNGPPYIIKLLNLPVTADEGFVEDLFKSRYTQFVKFKIVADPSSNILETHVIKKVAFVELHSYADLSKALKWQDLYYKGNRRVLVELADFGDFQHCIDFNKQHEQDIARIQDDFIAGRHREPSFGPRAVGASNRANSFPVNAPPLVAPSKPKPNPFGAAKPVDVLSKQQEIEKKLINLNKTTVQTLGPDGEAVDIQSTIKHFHEAASPRLRRKSINNSRRSSTEERRPSFSILKRPSISNASFNEKDQPDKSPESQKQFPITKQQSTVSPVTGTNSSNAGAMPAPPPQSVYEANGSGKSLAELLSGKNNNLSNTGRNSSRSQKSSPKPIVSKPVILKKKVPVVTTLSAETYSSDNVENTNDTEEGEVAAEGTPVVKEGQLVKESDGFVKQDVVIKDPAAFKKDEDSRVGALTNELVTSTISDSPGEVTQNLETSRKKVGDEQATANTGSAPARAVEEGRPDFKKHLNELVNSKSFLNKEKRSTRNRHEKHHGHENGDEDHHRQGAEEGRSRSKPHRNGQSNRFRNKSPKPHPRSNQSEEPQEVESKIQDVHKNGNSHESKRGRKRDTRFSAESKKSSELSSDKNSDVSRSTSDDSNKSSGLGKSLSGAQNNLRSEGKALDEATQGENRTAEQTTNNETKSGKPPRGRGRGRGSSRGSSVIRGRGGHRGRGGFGHNLQYVRPKPVEEPKTESA